jgi:HEPN domain-containing protein
LIAVEILYKSGHYNIALFQLQQAIEKLVKSFGIRVGAIKPEEMTKKISHLPHKVFTRLFEIQIEELTKQRKTSLFIPDIIPPHQRDSRKSDEILENTKRLYLKIKSVEQEKNDTITSEEIVKFIEGAEILQKIPDFDDNQLFDELKDDFIKIHKHFIECFKNDKNIREISEELIKNCDEIIYSNVQQYKKERIRGINYNYLSYVWINLSLMTSPHEQNSRYPSLTDDITPMKKYNHENYLIKSIPQLVELTNKSIAKYNEVFTL